MERSDRVIVAGAGPTGLLLAGELARRDVPCLLIDALDAPRDWDRATIVHPRSMEIFEALGLAERLLDRGVRIHTALIRSGGEPLGELELEVPGSRYGFDTGLSEEVTESVLAESLEATRRFGDPVDQPGRARRPTRRRHRDNRTRRRASGAWGLVAHRVRRSAQRRPRIGGHRLSRGRPGDAVGRVRRDHRRLGGGLRGRRSPTSIPRP